MFNLQKIYFLRKKDFIVKKMLKYLRRNPVRIVKSQNTKSALKMPFWNLLECIVIEFNTCKIPIYSFYKWTKMSPHSLVIIFNGASVP